MSRRHSRTRSPNPEPDTRGHDRPSHDRWVINNCALNSWYTKGLDNGSHLRVR